MEMETPKAKEKGETVMTDPHQKWLNKYKRRSLSIEVPFAEDQKTALLDEVINTDPTTKAGFLAQIEILRELTFNDPARRLVCRILRSAEKLIPDDEGA